MFKRNTILVGVAMTTLQERFMLPNTQNYLDYIDFGIIFTMANLVPT